MQPRFDRQGRRQYQHIDRQIRRRLRARGDDCAICHQPIDYTAAQYEPQAFEVDHIIPISRGGIKSVENARATHRHCNRQRSNTIDADAIAAGAQPETQPQPKPHTKAATQANTCPDGPCTRCNGIHNPQPGITFVTTRRWTP